MLRGPVSFFIFKFPSVFQTSSVHSALNVSVICHSTWGQKFCLIIRSKLLDKCLCPNNLVIAWKQNVNWKKKIIPYFLNNCSYLPMGCVHLLVTVQLFTLLFPVPYLFLHGPWFFLLTSFELLESQKSCRSHRSFHIFFMLPPPMLKS